MTFWCRAMMLQVWETNRRREDMRDGQKNLVIKDNFFYLFFSLSPFLSISIYLSYIYICFPLFLPLSLSIFLTILSTNTLEKREEMLIFYSTMRCSFFYVLTIWASQALWLLIFINNGSTFFHPTPNPPRLPAPPFTSQSPIPSTSPSPLRLPAPLSTTTTQWAFSRNRSIVWCKRSRQQSGVCV